MAVKTAGQRVGRAQEERHAQAETEEVVSAGRVVPETSATGDAPARRFVADAHRQEICRRSEAHRRKPGESIPIEEALEHIERSLA